MTAFLAGLAIGGVAASATYFGIGLVHQRRSTRSRETAAAERARRLHAVPFQRAS